MNAVGRFEGFDAFWHFNLDTAHHRSFSAHHPDLIGRFQDDFQLVAVFGDGAANFYVSILEPLQIPELACILWENNGGKR